MKCPSCGANQPERAICEYCGRAMPISTEQRVAQETNQRTEEQQAAHRLFVAQLAVAKAARHAFVWSLLGSLSCCFPLAIIGMVLTFRTRTLARDQNMAVPIINGVALVIALLSLASVVAFSIWFGIDMAQLSSRKDELRAKIAAVDQGELTKPLACDLAELWVLDNGWNDKDAIVIDGYDCAGEVLQQRDLDGEMPYFSFNPSSTDSRVTVTACYVKQGRWTVKALRERGGCE